MFEMVHKMVMFPFNVFVNLYIGIRIVPIDLTLNL